MADNIDRIKRDRLLFENTPKDQLLNLLTYGDKRQICDVLVKVLDSLVTLEEFSLDQGVNIGDFNLTEFKDKNREQIDKHLDIAINAFIGSVLSQEG